MTAEEIHDALRMVGRGLINHPKVVALAEHLATLSPAPVVEVSGGPLEPLGPMLFGADLAAEAGPLAEHLQPAPEAAPPQADLPSAAAPAQDQPAAVPDPASADPEPKAKSPRKRKAA